MKILLVIGITLIIFLVSCSKKQSEITPTTFVGKWTLYQVYGNDYWGGPAYWKTANPNTKIEFTSDGKYFRKYPTEVNYTLIGTYLNLSSKQIQITQINPPIPSYPTYSLDYNFENGGFMTWGIFGTEALIKEKFKIDN